jgi:hypothetical protein
MEKKILIVYYTQTGQLREIVDSVVSTLGAGEGLTIVYEELKPKPAFPFPWTSDSFFQAMPESVLGIPCELEPLSLKGDEDFDLIILAWQPWYLSPSIPIHAFLQLENAHRVLKGKPVLTIIGSRNMWISGQNRIREYLSQAGAIPAGNIVLYDRAPNLLSVLSIIRWLFTGEKGRYVKVIPPAGISNEDIRNAARFGPIIRKTVMNGDFAGLRPALINAGAVDVLTELVMIETRGIILFRLWARFIRKKGIYGDPARLGRVRLFKWYLLIVIYLVSPFATLLFYLIKPFRRGTLKKQVAFYQSK